MSPNTTAEPVVAAEAKPQGKPLPRSYKTKKSKSQKGCFGKPKSTKLWAAACEQTAASRKAAGDAIWGAIQAQRAITLEDLEDSDGYESIPTPIEDEDEDDGTVWEPDGSAPVVTEESYYGPKAESTLENDGNPNAHIL